jgi:transcriptional regulator GlxA family with amidase domain
MFTLLEATVIAPTTHESGQRSSCQLPARFMIREGLVGQAKVGEPAVAAWLRQRHAMGALICSVCTGLLIVAASGLLDGVAATLHWAVTEQVRKDADWSGVQLLRTDQGSSPAAKAARDMMFRMRTRP